MSTLSRSRRQLLRRACPLAAAAFSGWPAWAAPAPIVLGHSYPASGIFADTAAEMKAAIDAAVRVANAAGGIAGRSLKVVSVDDGYDAARSLDNAERLRREHGAIALVAPIGAANLALLAPWAERTGTALIGARSGADNQRAVQPHVFFNIATFGDEARHVARHLQTIGVQRVAVAAMNNPTGQACAQQFAAAAQAQGLQSLAAVAFDPAGSDAAQAARQLAAQQPRALLLAGGGLGAAQLVRHLLDNGLPVMAVYCLSLLQPQQLVRLLDARSNGAVFTQVMPRLDDPRLPLVARYRQALAGEAGAQPTAFGLEGFLSLRIALRGLAQPGAADSGTALARALESLGATEIDGFRIQYDRQSHHGTRYVDLGILSQGRITR